MSPVITIGADPEFFVSVNNKLTSAYGLVEGTKENPFEVDCGAVQVDGMALEFNIDPTSSVKEFQYNIDTVLREMRKLIPDEYKFEFVPTAKFGQEYIDEQPKKAKELGCEPDYCAYTGEVNEKPNGELGFRTAAGHVHIGIDQELDDTQKRQLVVLCDLLIGVPSILMDGDKERRKLYGKAGCYRPKPYGVEYRTLSNFWLKSEEYRTFVFERAVLAAKLLPKFAEVIGDFEESTGYSYTNLQKIINGSYSWDSEKIVDYLKGCDYV